MTDLHDLLEQDGRHWRDGFTAPDLDTMLAEVSRPQRSRARWVWPIVAAVLLLTVPLVTVLLRPDSHTHPGSTASPGTTSSGTTTPAPGSKLLGLVPWLGAAVGQGRDGRSVSVWVDVGQTPHWCMDAGLPVMQISAVETANRITIQVQADQPAGYQPPTAAPGTVPGCSLIAYRTVPMLVQLHAPIGRRSLVDAATGQSHALQQAADLPLITTPPAGYLDAGSTPSLGRLDFLGIRQYGDLQYAAGRSYRNGNNLLELVRYQKTPPTLQVQTTGTVLGHPAQVGYRDAAFCAGWSADGYSWQLCSYAYQPLEPHLPLTAAELLAAANSLR